MNREELLEVLYAACGADLDGRDAIKMADAVLQHLASQRPWTCSTCGGQGGHGENCPGDLASQRQEQRKQIVTSDQCLSVLLGGEECGGDQVGAPICPVCQRDAWHRVADGLDERLRAQAAAQGAQDEIHWKTRRSLLKERDEAQALVARLGEAIKNHQCAIGHATWCGEHARYHGTSCALLAEIAPTTPTP